jgi:hypothetical protein
MALFGIYASHTTESCPLNNINTANGLLQLTASDVESLTKKYKINTILGQYHSALEHTFIWIVDAENPHLIQQFCLAAKIASFNKITIVPLITFKEALEEVKKIHSL